MPEYKPLVTIKDLPCWPSEPRYEQIAEGAELQAQHIDLESAWTPWPDREEKTLEVGTHFHRVVLGISQAALKDICPELIKSSKAWQDMVGKLETVSTQAMQLWLGPDAAGLGWRWPPAVLTAYAEPFDTYADMSHLIKREDWPTEIVPRSIAYFCGPLKEE